MLSYLPQKATTLEKLTVTKNDYFKHCGFVFDTALPQDWLDEFADWCEENEPDVTYRLILSSTVWGYPPGHTTFGDAVTCCSEVLAAWKRRERVYSY